MPIGSNHKLKLLYLMKILLENTDEENPMTLNEILGELAKHQISAERKSIYYDLEALRQYGLDIDTRRSKTTRYYIANRLFELPELKLLVDAVQCSKAITHKKSNELIKKLESLTSCHQATKLHRQVYVADRVKTLNESIYYNVDTLHTAIAEDKQVSFRYFDYNLLKEKSFRKNGELYYASPYGLCWNEDNYYLVAFSEKYNDYTHYRVDRMTNIEIVDETRTPLPNMEKFNLAAYSRKVFNMFAGEEERVRLKVDNSQVNAVLDRFGKNIFLEEYDENSFTVLTDVAVSAPFYGWLVRYGNKVKILEPESVVKGYREHLKGILGEY